MPPATTSDFKLLGRLAAGLIYDNTSWINRRKEMLTILDDQWFSRQISIDYSLPEQLQPHRTGPDNEALYAIPVTLLRKSPAAFLNFDMKDETGRATSLMTREHNAEVSKAALAWAAAEALQETDPDDLVPRVRALVNDIASAPAAVAALRVRDLVDARDSDDTLRTLYDDSRFMWLAIALAENSVVMAEVLAGDGRRRLMKLSYEERNRDRGDTVAAAGLARGGIAPYSFLIESPFISAGTYHFELCAPAGLEVVDVRLREYRYLDALLPKEQRGPFAREPMNQDAAKSADRLRSGRRIHLYLPDGELTDLARVIVHLRVQRQGFVGASTMAGLAIFAVLLFFAACLPKVISHPAVTPSLLLLIPGIVATIIGRAENHGLTIRMLATARRSLLVSAACVYVGAMGIALSKTGSGQEPTSLLRFVMWALVGISGLSALLLWWARRLPRRRDEETLFDRAVLQVLRGVSWFIGPRP